MRDPVSRREALLRIGAAGAVFGGSAAAARLLFDRGGYDVQTPGGQRQVRSFASGQKIEQAPVFAIAKSSLRIAAVRIDDVPWGVPRNRAGDDEATLRSG